MYMYELNIPIVYRFRFRDTKRHIIFFPSVICTAASMGNKTKVLHFAAAVCSFITV